MAMQWVLRSWTALAVALLSACGGGGGGVGETDVSLSLPVSRIESSMVDRGSAQVEVIVRINGLEEQQVVFVSATGGEALFSRGELIDAGDNRVAVRGTVRNDLTVGVHTDTVTFSLCRDEACSGGPIASTVTATIVITVLPNIEVAPLVTLSRTGAQAAPATRVPVSIPGPAGSLQMFATALGGGIDVQLVGSELVVTTQPLRAGVYESLVEISSTSDGRYSTRTTVRYTVEAPAGGEQALAALAAPVQLALPQGARVTQRLQVRPSTWTSEPITAAIETVFPFASSAATVSRVSDTEFDLTIDLAGFTSDTYLGNLVFTQGVFGGIALLAIRVDVSPPFTLDTAPGFRVEPSSTAAALTWRSAVTMADGSTARWTASVNQPWITVRTSSGMTGRDAVELVLNPDPKSYPPVFAFPVAVTRLTVSVDRAGVAAQTWDVPVENLLPSIMAAAPGALSSGSARVVVRGNALSQDLINRGALGVAGATLVSASFVADPGYVGDINVMLLDLAGITVGQDVTLRINHPLLTTTAVLIGPSSSSIPAGRADLAFGAYRPPSYSARHNAWYFASGGRVFKLGQGAPGWALQQQLVADVMDVDLTGDHLRLVAAAPQRFVMLDPATLGTVATTTALSATPLTTIDTRMLPRSKTLAFAPDGALFVGLVDDAVARPDLDPLLPANQYGYTRPGRFLSSPQPRNIVVSADRGRIVVQNRSGAITPNESYAVPPRALGATATLSLAHDADIVAVSNDGTRTLDANGVVRSLGGNADLRSAIPATHGAVGFGLTPNGRHGLVHAVRRSGSGAGEQALDALLIVVDVQTLPAAAPLTVAQTIPMSAAVGCLLPRSSGESCAHVASVSVDAAARMALVLGPRGVEVVPLPAAVRAAATSRDQAQQRLGIQRPVLGP
jgi:hypothetical protein